MLYFNEGMTTLLNFSVEDVEDVIHINNNRTEFESAKASILNKTSKDALIELSRKNEILKGLYNSFVCISYIDPQITYVNPCEYIDFITNSQYHTLINIYYAPTRRSDFPGFRKTAC